MRKHSRNSEFLSGDAVRNFPREAGARRSVHTLDVISTHEFRIDLSRRTTDIWRYGRCQKTGDSLLESRSRHGQVSVAGQHVQFSGRACEPRGSMRAKDSGRAGPARKLNLSPEAAKETLEKSRRLGGMGDGGGAGDGPLLDLRMTLKTPARGWGWGLARADALGNLDATDAGRLSGATIKGRCLALSNQLTPTPEISPPLRASHITLLPLALFPASSGPLSPSPTSRIAPRQSCDECSSYPGRVLRLFNKTLGNRYAGSVHICPPCSHIPRT